MGGEESLTNLNDIQIWICDPIFDLSHPLQSHHPYELLNQDL